MTFDQLFVRAMGIEARPFPFQRRFATGAKLPSLVRVPTGLGKTAMAVLGWLWRRRYSNDGGTRTATPRRLVYCLPMRVLVEQTRDAVAQWLAKLYVDADIGVHVLMGGEESDDWDLHPERDAILIGTQDMLLSRALNRGYGMSRYRWPMHFGLLNNDCLWVFDEVQLMDVGVATSAQLEGFRRLIKTFGPVQSVWMSATLDETWLHTVDLPKERLGWRLELDKQKDLQNEYVQKLWTALKALSKADDARMGDAPTCAEAIARAHVTGTKTLAVFNTVKQAVTVFRELSKYTDAPRVLIHSRFRPRDRESHLETFLRGENIIAVTTQVVEAGVDVSATTLLTELAPWASLVQRFGRCNRRGDDQGAKVIWFDPGEVDDKFNAAPYETDDLREARRLLFPCKDVSLEALDGIDADMPLEPAHVIRRRDLVDLFDTTPDLAGNDIDVSRFIRSGDEHDVKVFWRDFDGDPEGQAAPRRDELCSAPVGELKAFRKDKDHRFDVWRWDGLDEGWRQVAEREIYAGQTYLIRASAGGYTAEAGWDPKNKIAAAAAELPSDLPDAHSRDYETGPWLSIAEHTDDVVKKLDGILESLALPETCLLELREAARWHDWGKVHEQFQGSFRDDNRPGSWKERGDVGKACKGFWKGYEKKGFRHELASALGMVAQGQPDLSAYLAAAHHGKVRLSIRSMPNEKHQPEPERLYARGVWEGDVLPEVKLGGGVTARETRLSLEPMQMGRSANGAMSWAERVLRLRDEYGPFRLAYLEALLRAADMGASEDEAKRAPEECP